MPSTNRSPFLIKFAATLGALALSTSASFAQAPPAPPTPFERQLAKIDLAIQGKGEFTSQVNGNNYLNQAVTLKPSNTLGALVTIRYTKSPLIGGEFNYAYARYTDDFTVTNTSTSPAAAAGFILGVQTTASEYTFGYLAHLRRQYYGATPFASIGAGSTAFRPTKGGGQGNLPQARATYYYSVGADLPLYGDHFGLRATFRQSFMNAPDYQQNYWRIYKHAIATEPAVGIYIRF